MVIFTSSIDNGTSVLTNCASKYCLSGDVYLEVPDFPSATDQTLFPNMSQQFLRFFFFLKLSVDDKFGV